MFGDILIDKFRYAYKKSDISHEDIINMRLCQNYYFPDSSIDYKCGNILATFTPTKMTGERGDNSSHNLQMPEQDMFFECLSDITLDKPEIQQKCRLTLIHLTKNFLLSKPVNEYISVFTEKQYSRLVPEVISSSNDGSYSLYLRYSHDVDSEYNPKFLIKFYDKVAEYYKQHKTYICHLQEPLTEYEKSLVGGAYDEEKRTLNLECLNILRIEIEFHGSEKIKPIKLNLDTDRDFLSLDLIINSLREGKFYTTLDKIFTETLKKLVFNAEETLDSATAELSKIRKLACKLLFTSSRTYHYKAVADELGLENQFSTINSIIKKIVPDSELYQELYNSVFITGDNEESTPVKCVIRSCNSYSSQLLKVFILVYEVPILDDS